MRVKDILNRLFVKSTVIGTVNLTDLTGNGILTGSNIPFGWGNKSNINYLELAYGNNPYVFEVVDDISKRASMLPFRLTDINNKEREIMNNEFTSLWTQPNSVDSNQEFLYRIFANFLVCGEAFVIGMKGAGFTKYNELTVPTTTNVEVLTNSIGDITGYRVTSFDNSTTYEPEEVLHILKPDITKDSNRGLSPLDPGQKVWESNNEIWASEASLHRNKGINGVLYNDGNRVMTPKEQADTQAQYDSDYTGSSKFGKVKVSNQKLGFLQMGINPNDLKSIETRIEHLRTICAIYGVQSQLYNDPGNKTYNNVKEAEVSRMTDVIIPLVTKVFIELSNWLLKDNLGLENIKITIDKEQIPELNRPALDLSNKVVSELQAGILTPEEAKEILYPNLV